MKSLILAAVLIFGINAPVDAGERYVYAFTDDACAPCKKMLPVWKALEDRGYKVHIYKSEKMKAKYNIDAVPTTLVMEAGVEKKRFVGYTALKHIAKVLKTLVPFALSIIGL